MDNTLKALRETPDTLTVGNYIVLFGGRDLEGVASPSKNADGTTGQFFTEQTTLESDYTKTGRLYVDWEHGWGGEGEPQRDNVLGYVDWKTARADTTGVWVERVLNRRSEYMQYLEQLISDGLIGNSSEAVEDVAIGDDGEIKRWPLKRDTLTVTPMEPRMMSENVVTALKALGFNTSDETPEAQAPEGAKAPARAVDSENVSKTPDVVFSEPTIMEANIMPDEQVETTEVKALQIDYGLLAAALVDEQEKRQESKPPEAKSAGMITNMETAEDRKVKDGVPLYATIGEFCKAIADNPNDAKLGALRSDEAINEGGFSLAGALGPRKVSSLSAAKAKAISGMSELVPADGGLLVGTDIRPGIMERVYSTGLLLQMLNIMPISNTSNSMTLYGVAETSRADGSRLGGVQAYWAAEGDEKTGSKPKFEEINFKLNKVIGLVYSTDELLQDAGALDSWIMSRLPNELRFKVEDAVIRGTGGGQPLGILSSAALISITKEVGQAADTIVSENIIKQRARRWAGVNDYVYLINQDTEPQLHQLNLPVGTGGALVYMPPGGLSAAPYGSLYGRPVIPTEYNPTVGDVGDLLMISPSQYQMVDKGGIQAAASIHVRFIYDESVFRFVYRVDGKPMWNSELTPYQGTNTQSPFVAIAARA